VRERLEEFFAFVKRSVETQVEAEPQVVNRFNARPNVTLQLLAVNERVQLVELEERGRYRLQKLFNDSLALQAGSLKPVVEFSPLAFARAARVAVTLVFQERLHAIHDFTDSRSQARERSVRSLVERFPARFAVVALQTVSLESPANHFFFCLAVRARQNAFSMADANVFIFRWVHNPRLWAAAFVYQTLCNDC
jgi:hypothetical protein